MRTALLALCAAALLPDGARARAINVAQLSLDRLGDLSLEQLGTLRVTSVSRHSERLLQAPTSVFVITGEDIHRAGARTLPEALRLAPNLQVARTSAGQWAISARGFNNAIGNKLLVLVDGRTVYSPLFSGVFWEAQGLMLEDIEQIEVISGPGGTLWGANAVNGVINVKTRPASATQGGLAVLSGGRERNDVAMRYGGALAADAHFRLYAMNSDRGASDRANGTRVPDAARMKHAGFRADWGQPDNAVTMQGAIYSGGDPPGTPESPDLAGAHLLARWSSESADGTGWHLQAYYDRARRKDFATFNDAMEIADVEWQHSSVPWPSHRLVWGVGHRVARDKTQPTLLVRFNPAERELRWSNVYVQDVISLPNQVAATLGAKVESNVYTGWEFLPSARLAWSPDENRSGWIAWSRAIRAPARLDREFFFPGRPPFFINGGPNFVSEVASVWELGWRAQPAPNLSWSLTMFRHDYDRLRSGQRPPAVVQNMMKGHVQGAEGWGQWQVTPDWRLSGGFVVQGQQIHIQPGSTDPTGPSALGNDPSHQWMLRSNLRLAGRQELDIGVRRVGALPSPAVPAYTAVDVRWAWQASSSFELSLNIQNLFDPKHVEFGDPATAPQVRRNAWLMLQWRM